MGGVSGHRKKSKIDGSGFYNVQEAQSAQHLVSAPSFVSFGSSPSDAHLETRGVHYNRGFDIDHNPSGQAGATGYNDHESYKPIQIIAADVNRKSSSQV